MKEKVPESISRRWQGDCIHSCLVSPDPVAMSRRYLYSFTCTSDLLPT